LAFLQRSKPGAANTKTKQQSTPKKPVKKGNETWLQGKKWFVYKEGKELQLRVCCVVVACMCGAVLCSGLFCNELTFITHGNTGA
jgi:hypothetical protein